MYTIENEVLKVTVHPLGAELQSIFNKQTGIEYLWNGDPKFWAKRSPVLFPIVGTLRNNSYLFHDFSYALGRHGFAREKVFSLVEEGPHALSFELKDDPETLKLYPFQFSLVIRYLVEGNKLQVSLSVKNTGSRPMYFSIGSHPAFRLPLVESLEYADYYLMFNKIEKAGRWPINNAGLLEGAPSLVLNETSKLPLEKSLFYNDALVFKHLRSDEVTLRSDKNPHGLDFHFPGFPFLGIWAAKDADFVCIEPWCGVTDAADSNQLLTDKEGMNYLGAGQVFERSWSVSTW